MDIKVSYLEYCERATFLKRAGLGLSAAALSGDAFASASRAIAAGEGPPMAANSPAEALALLRAGNARFVAGKPQCGPLIARVAEVAAGQSPFAVVLGCSDSRVPIETVFDQVPGNVFVVRIAGNFLNNDGLGSIEYAVSVFKSKLILVLGHTSCGAVTAAVTFVRDGTTLPSHIQDVVAALAPAAEATRGSSGDWVANAIAENVKRNVQAATSSTIVADAVKGGSLQVAGGIYDLRTGSVAFL
jgi:carbonic anhydrase